jgi:atypical dual specificity phosphatase
LGTGGKFLRRIRATVAAEPTGFVWIEDGRLAGSGLPASASQVRWLSQKGIGAILTLTERPLPEEWTRDIPIVTDHVPMADHSPPDAGSLDRAVGIISGRLAEGRNVVVHCLAGEGRTGCVLAAYLISKKRMTAADAIAQLREIKPEFVERRQEHAVEEYASKVAGVQRE